MKDPFEFITEDIKPLSGGNIQASKSDYGELLANSAEKWGIPDKLPILERILNVESGGNPNAKSPKGASGLMQLMPGTARALGVKNINDPQENIDAGVRYYAEQLKTFGSDDLALAAYNAGPGAVRRFNGIPPYKETQAYVNNILSPISGKLGGGFYDSRGDRLHYGGDIAAEAGTPFIAPTRLMITNVRNKMSNSPGGMVWGTDPQTGLQFRFHHVMPGVKAGDVVEAGSPLGTLSDISGPHLDMKVYDPKKGQFIDWLAQNKLNRGAVFAQGQPLGVTTPQDTSNMVTDVSGQSTPVNVQNPQSVQKQQTISQILSDLAQKIGPREAVAAEPPKPTLTQQVIKQEMQDPFAHITADIKDPFAEITSDIGQQPELTTGQQIARTVAPYTKHIIPGITMGLAGAAAAPAAVASYGAAEIPALSFGAYVGNDIQNRIERYAGLKETPNTTMDYLKDVGKNAWQSINEGTAAALIGGGLNKALGYISENIAPALYKIAMKPSTTIKPAKSDQLIETGLTEGISIGRRGLNKVARELDQTGREIMAMANEATAQGTPFPLDRAAARLDSLIAKYRNSPIPSEYIDKINAFKSQMLAERGTVITPTQAQQMKMDLYKTLPDSVWGEQFPTLIKDIRRTLSRGLKEELETIMPEVKAYNEKYGKLAEFNKVLERAVNRVENREILNMYDLAVGGTAGGASGNVGIGAISAIGTRILRDPTISSYLAIAMKRMAFANYKNIVANPIGHVVGEKSSEKIGNYLNSLREQPLEPSYQP